MHVLIRSKLNPHTSPYFARNVSTVSASFSQLYLRSRSLMSWLLPRSTLVEQWRRLLTHHWPQKIWLLNFKSAMDFAGVHIHCRNPWNEFSPNRARLSPSLCKNLDIRGRKKENGLITLDPARRPLNCSPVQSPNIKQTYGNGDLKRKLLHPRLE